eukprot:TRINITY_DN871_c0_g2_i2.p1 TRINITY_DN871_c0_g2~~TRINITY_DN871_c0_g2_i2.p1  ORF type:complete len:352 (-),score=30.42 TRINITY_DN871_c0_g2_i2:16-1071(-)
MLGFSWNYWWAIIARLIGGFFNSFSPAAKAYIGDITDESNKVIGFSTFGIAWGLGAIVGPVIGGFFAQPAVKYSSIFSTTGIFGQYPYLLPCIVACSLCGISFSFSSLYLTESLKKKDPIQDDDLQGIEMQKSLFIDSDSDSEYQNEETNVKEESSKRNSILAASAILTYLVTCAGALTSDEVFPLWAMAGREVGGLGFDTNLIGTVMICGGFAMFVGQGVFFPLLAGKCPTRCFSSTLRFHVCNAERPLLFGEGTDNCIPLSDHRGSSHIQVDGICGGQYPHRRGDARMDGTSVRDFIHAWGDIQDHFSDYWGKHFGVDVWRRPRFSAGFSFSLYPVSYTHLTLPTNREV